jgi:hypothetical protein
MLRRLVLHLSFHTVSTLSGASGKLIEISRAADNLQDNDVTLRDSPHDYSRPSPEP